MSRKYKFHDQEKLYFVTYTAIKWIDLFTKKAYRDIIVASLDHCISKKGLEVYAWCIMTNHVHLIIGTHGNNMEDILRDHKKHTSLELLKSVQNNQSESRRDWMLEQFLKAGQANSNNTHYQLWQQHNKPMELYSADVLYQKLDYIHNNPVKAGFVDRAEDWVYSSARDYCGIPGLLHGLSFIEVGLRN
jgi:REP element-mobilizing transposase RayT